MDIMKNIVDFLSNVNNSASLLITVIVLFLTWLYINHTRKTVDGISRKQYSEDTVEGVDRAVEARADDEISDMLRLQSELDEEDIEEIKKGVNLDITDPKSVKQYVQRLRTKAYKQQSLTQSEKDREELAKKHQLAQIYVLLNEEKDTFGETSMANVKEQMSLYCS